jgi:hypothetical protein
MTSNAMNTPALLDPAALVAAMPNMQHRQIRQPSDAGVVGETVVDDAMQPKPKPKRIRPPRAKKPAKQTPPQTVVVNVENELGGNQQCTSAVDGTAHMGGTMHMMQYPVQFVNRTSMPIQQQSAAPARLVQQSVVQQQRKVPNDQPTADAMHANWLRKRHLLRKAIRALVYVREFKRLTSVYSCTEKRGTVRRSRAASTTCYNDC